MPFRRASHALALGLSVFSLGCASLREDSDDRIARLDEIVETSWHGGETTEALVVKFGEPLSKRIEQIPNRYDAKQTDEIWTLTYPSFQARVYKVLSERPHEFLIGLWVADSRYEVGPFFEIGTDLKRIDRLFEGTCETISQNEWAGITQTPSDRCRDDDCDEDDCETEFCALRCGPAESTVLFRLRHDRVVRIDWNYHWQ
jgi:hypothetical protein